MRVDARRCLRFRKPGTNVMFHEEFRSLLAATDPNGPIRELPVVRANPFDFSRLNFADLQALFLWNKLLFDPLPLPMNPFFSSDSNLYPGADMFRSTPTYPTDDHPIRPPEFR
jgi:hypothetical protein